jgi:hypothetical protein
MTRLALSLLAALVLALGATTATANAAKLKKGVYDCMRYDYYSSSLIFTNAVKLKDGGKYEHAFGRKGKKLSEPSKGTYKIKGKKIKFRKGGMAGSPGKIEKEKGEPAYFRILYKGEPSGIDCYYVPKP